MSLANHIQRVTMSEWSYLCCAVSSSFYATTSWSICKTCAITAPMLCSVAACWETMSAWLLLATIDVTERIRSNLSTERGGEAYKFCLHKHQPTTSSQVWLRPRGRRLRVWLILLIMAIGEEQPVSLYCLAREFTMLTFLIPTVHTLGIAVRNWACNAISCCPSHEAASKLAYYCLCMS